MSGLVGAQCDVTPVIHHGKTMDLDAGSAVLHTAGITRKDIQLETKNKVHQYSGPSIDSSIEEQYFYDKG